MPPPPLQVVFQNEGMSLVGSLFLLEEGKTPVPVVVLLHGFTGHRLEAWFLFPRLARRLNAAGIAALTFDFRGSGESDGEFKDMTVQGEVRDAHKAVDFIKTASGIDASRIGVVGYSLGGCVASHVLGERADISAAVLWAPAAYMAELAQGNLAEADLALDTVPPNGVPVGSLMTGPEFYRTLPELDAVGACKKSSAPILVIHGDEDQSVPVEHGRRFVATLKERPAESRLEELHGAGHPFDHLDAVEKLFKLTVSWFEKHLGR